MNSTHHQDRTEQMEIDASAKWPVLVFFGSAVKWLLLGGVLQLIASIQLHNPACLGG
jgi:cytochrome c oxidase cbb3-type subunit 1